MYFKKCIHIMFVFILCFVFNCMVLGKENHISTEDLDCHGSRIYNNVTLTGYYPIYEANDDENSDYLDRFGKKLRTLQDYLDGHVGFVTVSMDNHLNIPYGTNICIPELNRYFKQKLNLQIRDTAENVLGMGWERVDICVRSESDSYAAIVNLENATLVF